MFLIVMTGRGQARKLHAQTIDGRRLCSCKYKVETGPAQEAPFLAANDMACVESVRATRTLPRVLRSGNGVHYITVAGLGHSLVARTKQDAAEMLQELGFGAYRFADARDPRPRRVLTIAEREEQRSQLMATHDRMRYWGD